MKGAAADHPAGPAWSSVARRYSGEGSDEPDIIGTGVAFPLRVDPAAGSRSVGTPTTWRRRSRVILGTAPGERPMRPEFGCGIHDYVFESIDAYTLGRLDDEIRDALDRWEPRIEVIDVDFDLDGAVRASCASTSRTAAGHERHPQPRLSLLSHPGRGVSE